MLQIDHQSEHWRETLGIDLELLLKKSNTILLETMLSVKARTLLSKSVSAASG
jgi:hypothetical protein